jgi:hypothetical protein
MGIGFGTKNQAIHKGRVYSPLPFYFLQFLTILSTTFSCKENKALPDKTSPPKGALAIE